MKHKELPSFIELDKRLTLCKKSPSGLAWKTVGTRGIKPGDFAGKKLPNGYWVVRFNGQSYYAHRIVFKLQTQIDPGDKEVDHIQGLDSPLLVRLATSSENNYNLKKRKNALSKFKGVRKKRNKWQAGICMDGKYKNLGVYTTEIEAAYAYNSEALKLFGKHARINTF